MAQPIHDAIQWPILSVMTQPIHDAIQRPILSVMTQPIHDAIQRPILSVMTQPIHGVSAYGPYMAQPATALLQMQYVPATAQSFNGTA